LPISIYELFFEVLGEASAKAAGFEQVVIHTLFNP
tara:strand:- start:534 stop:638 length:105 start_codon:yes stop_codon:yes gene_type:complete